MKSINAALRIATQSDALALADLGRRSFISAFAHLYSADSLEAFLRETRSQETYRHFIDSDKHHLLLADASDNGIVGYSLCGPLGLPVLKPQKPAFELKRLYIDPNHQSSGIGQQLMEFALNTAVSERASAIYLGVYSENFGAQRFYERNGFAKIGSYDFKVGDHIDHEFIFERKLL